MGGTEFVNWRWTIFDVVRTVCVLFSHIVIATRGAYGGCQYVLYCCCVVSIFLFLRLLTCPISKGLHSYVSSQSFLDFLVA